MLALQKVMAYEKQDNDPESQSVLGVGWVWHCAAYRDAHLALPCLSRTLRHWPSYSRDSLSNAFARHGNVASRVAFPVAGLPFLARELSMLVLFLP